MNNVEKFALGILGTSAVVAGVLAARGKKRRAGDTQRPYYKNYHKPAGFYEAHVKRPLDCYLSSLALVVLSPVLGVTALLVKRSLGSPVLFEQARPGKDGKIFKLYKFRTMTDAKDASGKPLSDADRLTPFGEKLRSTSIDELPELINIAEGDMAIVGPRPWLIEYLPYYNSEEIHRHDVLPGLTGMAQINGRNGIGWDERLKYDVEYVQHITFIQDLRIVLKTAGKVFRSAGVAVDTDSVETWFNEERAGKNGAL
ncbi:MAG: sugar transferase [Lachnospiraceae bacterium]|nr:sugar transferase [Lachnospiraceae bacterium]